MLTKEEKTREVDYRLAEALILHMAKAGQISTQEYELIRDRLIDEFNPVIGALERGLPYKFRVDLKGERKNDRERRVGLENRK